MTRCTKLRNVGGVIKTVIGELLEIDEAAKLLGVSVKTVYGYNTRGTRSGEGPKRYRVGKKICYKESDLQSWMERVRVR